MRLLALLALIAPTSALALECGPSQSVYAVLSEKYDERRVSIGLAADAASIIEIWASEAGTWSALVTLPDGRTCILSAGSDFRQFAQGNPA